MTQETTTVSVWPNLQTAFVAGTALMEFALGSAPDPQVPDKSREALALYEAKLEKSYSSALPKSLIENWLGLAKSKFSKETYAKVASLAARSDGWRGVGSSKLKGNSLKNFLAAWNEISKTQDAAEPYVSLSPRGEIYAEWHASWKRHLDAKFNVDGTVVFGLLHGNEEIAGKSRIKSFLNLMKSREPNPFSWHT